MVVGYTYDYTEMILGERNWAGLKQTSMADFFPRLS